jgi:glutathione-specific gamma-glutamylcyclotransferase
MNVGNRKFSLTRDLIESDALRKAFSERSTLRPWTDAELADSLDRVLPAARMPDGVWVFGYGSLLWNPCLRYAESRPATLYGRRRALALWSRFGRGSESAPGLLFSLVPGGSCQGLLFRIAPEHCDAELSLLWRREMIAGSYDPKVFRVRCALGTIPAIAFDANRGHPSYCAPLPLAEQVRIIFGASGFNGSNVDYVLHTLDAMRAHGIRDRGLEALGKSLGHPAPTLQAFDAV